MYVNSSSLWSDKCQITSMGSMFQKLWIDPKKRHYWKGQTKITRHLFELFQVSIKHVDFFSLDAGEYSWKLWPNVNRCFSHPGGGRVQEWFKDRRAWQSRGWQVQEPQLSVWTREPGWTICIVNIGRKIIHAIIDFVVKNLFLPSVESSSVDSP